MAGESEDDMLSLEKVHIVKAETERDEIDQKKIWCWALLGIKEEEPIKQVPSEVAAMKILRHSSQ